MADHPPYPKNDHLFSEWMPYDKMTIYRVCLHPECKVMEKKKAQ